MTTNVQNSEKIKRFTAGMMVALVELEELTPEETEIALAEVNEMFCSLDPRPEIQAAFLDFTEALGEFYSDEWRAEDA
jgi:hypothetical protein